MKKDSLKKLLQVHAEIYDNEKKKLVEEVIIEECGEDNLIFKNEDLVEKELKDDAASRPVGEADETWIATIKDGDVVVLQDSTTIKEGNNG